MVSVSYEPNPGGLGAVINDVDLAQPLDEKTISDI